MLRMRSGVSKLARVIERKARLDGSVTEFVCLGLLVEPGRRAVLRYEVDRDWDVAAGAIRVPRGTVTIAHYWIDRPFNVYHWIDRGTTLGYYCNVAAGTAIEAAEVRWTDLVVDVLLRPSGALEILDEDELPDDLAPEHRRTVARALEQIVTDPRRLGSEIERSSRELL